MSRKDYVRMAKIIRQELTNTYGIDEVSIWNIAKAVADWFEEDNPRFKRASFYDACGFEPKAAE